MISWVSNFQGDEITVFHKPPVFSRLYMPSESSCRSELLSHRTSFVSDCFPDVQVGGGFFLPTVVSWTWDAETQKLGTET